MEVADKCRRQTELASHNMKSILVIMKRAAKALAAAEKQP